MLYAGQVAEEGIAMDVLTRPVHPYTRGLLASVPGLSVRRKGDDPRDTGPAAKPDQAGTGLPFRRPLRTGRTRLPKTPSAAAVDIGLGKSASRGLPGRDQARGDCSSCLIPPQSRSGG
ncbi:hypothetical protein [Mesorhizobium sp. M0019]|uniref:ABC transporter ATP-binding protein n=1 Tax=Mesorhizobium sp. M0019 TaxID=2956845 RepID=UPI00333AA418